MIVAMLLAAVVAATPADLSPAARSAIAPVLDAIAAERAAQAALPPAKDDAERLVRLGRLDQSGRRGLGQVDFAKAPEAERQAAFQVMRDAIAAVDDETLPQVLAMVPPEGWFLKSRYGEAASRAAFHVIQHSDPDQWRRFVPILGSFAAKGEVNGQDYALMYDRLEMNEGRPQRYGSQFTCVAGKNQLHTLEDPARVDEFRRGMGLPPLAEYVAAFERMNMPC